MWICLFTSEHSAAIAETKINVAFAVQQPPFLIDTKTKEGLTTDLIAAMNEIQDDYLFSLKILPTRRLYTHYKSLKIDLVAFSNIDWGWANTNAKASLPMANSYDLFISKIVKEPRFDSKRPFAAVRGFHYKFANYSQERLNTLPNVHLVNDELAVITMLRKERVQFGIISDLHLRWLSITDPDFFKGLNINWTSPDNHHERHFVITEDARISVSAFNAIIKTLAHNGQLQTIYKRFGLETPNF